MVAAENKLSLLSDGCFLFGAHEVDLMFASFMLPIVAEVVV